MNLKDTLLGFYKCVKFGHDQPFGNPCTRCGAEKNAPTLVSLLAEVLAKSALPSALCRSCWLSLKEPPAMFYLSPATEVVCLKCQTTVDTGQVVWIASPMASFIKRAF